MMTLCRLLPILLLPAAALADNAALFLLETYSLPTATWMKIPTTMRDDHALLRTTLIGQLPKGSVQLEDRVGGRCRSSQKNIFEALEEISVPTSFAVSETTIYPAEWEVRKVGSSLDLGANFSKSATIGFTLTSVDPIPRPLLKAGRRLDVERATRPVFSMLRLDSTVPIAPVTLVSIAPDPSHQERQGRLLLSFLVTTGLPADADAAKREPGYTIELLGLRGSTRTNETATPVLMKNLLRRSDAHAFTIAATQTPGPRGSLDAVQQIPHPSKAEKGPTGPVPSAIESAVIGTILSAQLSPISDGKVAVVIQINHDWQPPLLPTIPGAGDQLIENTRIPYTMQLRVRSEIDPDTWTLLTTQPLSDVFGPDDRSAKDESCYLFGRLVIRK